MAARCYTVSWTAVAVTVAADIVEITPADDKKIEVYGIVWKQYTDVGDAAEEIIPWSVIRGHTTSGSGGTATTPRPLDRDDPAAGFTAEMNNTTAASAGTTVVLHADATNIRVGESMFLPEGSGWTASQADTTLVIRMGAAPADSITTQGTIYVREF